MNHYDRATRGQDRSKGPVAAPDDLPEGSTNANPEGIALVDLLKEEFRTHDRNPFEPGFWALAAHRFGNWRMDIRPRLVRAPFSVAYKAAYTAINWLWGIDLGY